MFRPHALLLTLLGFLLHRDVAVFSGTFIDVLARLDISEEAARSALTRAAGRGYLDRARVGRKTYFSLTDKSKFLLADGERRMLHELSDPDADTWTLVTFSLPEQRRDIRHSLRTGLEWRGFGLLRDGLWIAPGAVELADLVDELDVHEDVRIFRGELVHPDDARGIVAEAWDLDDLAARYGDFVARWRRGAPIGGRSALARQVALITDWRQLLVGVPRLPSAYLPARWPAAAAAELFRTKVDALDEAAEAELEELLDSVPLRDVKVKATRSPRGQAASPSQRRVPDTR